MKELEFFGESIKQMLQILFLLIILALFLPWLIKKILAPKKKVCGSCGYQLAPTDKFCPQCGKSVEG